MATMQTNGSVSVQFLNYLSLCTSTAVRLIGRARETISRLAFDSAKRYWQTVKICFMMPEKNMLDNLF